MFGRIGVLVGQFFGISRFTDEMFEGRCLEDIVGDESVAGKKRGPGPQRPRLRKPGNLSL